MSKIPLIAKVKTLMKMMKKIFKNRITLGPTRNMSSLMLAERDFRQTGMDTLCTLYLDPVLKCECSTFRSSFLRFPGTRLGRLMSCARVADMLQLCEEFVPGDPPEFFFDKNPENFGSVLEMYRSGKFHIPDGGRGEEGGHNVQMFSEAE